MFAADQTWRTTPFVAFDLETTGRDADQDRIIEIGIVRFEGGEVVDRWSQLVQPERHVSDEIVALTGITNDDLVGKPIFADVVEETMRRLDAPLWLAFNCQFDIGFLLAELRRIGRTDAARPCLDPLPFGWKFLRSTKATRNARLGTLCEYLEIPLESAHRADHDAEAAGRVLLALADRFEIEPTIQGLFGQQKAFHEQMEESFQRFRKGGDSSSVLASQSTDAVELGPGFLHSDETDPVRYLVTRLTTAR